MRSLIQFIFAAFIASIFPFADVKTQSFENAWQYMEYIGNANETLTAFYLSYLSAMGHNKSARKVEKRRQEVLASIFETRVKIQNMPPWKGDKTFRDTTVAYLKMLNTVFNEDYGKIVDMEEIAEQSYDAMEAYMLAQEKAWEKLDNTAEKQNEMQKQFAAKYNITLIESDTKIEKKSKQAADLMKHYNNTYLVFFKAFKQEAYLMDAIDKKNIIAIEQNKSSLRKFAEEGITKLKTMKSFNNDPSLINACRDAMNFFKSETAKTRDITDFFLKDEAFTKLKKNFESKPAAKRTQQDIDQYNKGVNEINTAVNEFNSANKQLNKERQSAVNNWNNTVKNFLDEYMPVQRKQIE